jgi:3-oxoacyl-[acyl-carrier protein] reductase
MTISFDFSGRTVLVTGAAQGIGLALARRFAEAGARVAVADRAEDALREQWGDASDHVLPWVLDVADPAACDACIAAVTAWSGTIDVLVNNAGITRDAMVWKLTDADWNAVIGVHLTGTFNLTRAVLPAMRAAGYGRIVNVTSYTGMHGNLGQANYAAAKAGIIGFTKNVAKDVARFGITTNAISPNAATAMVAAIPPDKLAALVDQIPLGRFGEPEEMTAAALFLASDDAGYITGVVLPVDGGLSM